MGQQIDLGEFVIDRDYYSVVYKNNKICLSKRLFDMLFLLAENNNNYINIYHIFNELWRFDCDSDIKTVNTHISKLRNLVGVKIDCKNSCYKLII